MDFSVSVYELHDLKLWAINGLSREFCCSLTVNPLLFSKEITGMSFDEAITRLSNELYQGIQSVHFLKIGDVSFYINEGALVIENSPDCPEYCDRDCDAYKILQRKSTTRFVVFKKYIPRLFSEMRKSYHLIRKEYEEDQEYKKKEYENSKTTIV